MNKFLDALDAGFTDTEIGAIATEPRETARSLIANEGFVLWIALTGVGLTIWLLAR